MALPLTLPDGQPAPIGWIAGKPVWPARGARKNGMEFVVDGLDGDDPDEFDADDEQDDDGDDEQNQDRRGGQARKRTARRDADADDDDDEPDDGDETDEADDGTDEGGEAPWEPPTREQWRKVEDALRRNNGENRKMRLTKKAMTRLGITDEQEFSDWLLDRGIDPETGNRLVDLGEDAGSGSSEQDADSGEQGGTGERRSREQVVLERRRAEERGAARTAERYRPALVQFAAAAALSEAKYTGTDMALALRLFDTSDIDVEFDENGDPVVYGLDDQVDKIKQEFPQLFERKSAGGDTESTQRRRNGRTSNGRTGARSIDGGDRGRTAPAPKGWLAQLDKRITGGR
jgi:hypothetical protein